MNATQPQHDQQPAAAPRKRRRWPWITAALIALLIIGAIAGHGGTKTPAAPQPSGHAAAPATSPANPGPPSPSAAPSTAPAAPAPTVAQQQALDSAQSYLSEGTGFSKRGLIKQLTSQYGEGFTLAQARWAVRHAHPDWDQQAADSAKGYLNDGGGFSRASLIQQLTSPYGEDFTLAQATYGADQAGL